MSNRILGFLILLGFALAITAFYLYFFKYNRVNIIISSNLPDYEVELYSDIKNTSTKKCEEKECIFKDFSPFNYKVKVTKPGYKDFYYKLNIRDNGITKVDVVLKKNIYLTKLEIEDIKAVSYIIEEKTKEEKIKELKERKFIIKSFFLDNLGKFTFKHSGKKLELFKGDKSLGLFDNTKPETLNVRQIYYTDSFIFINIGEKKYLYNLISKNFYIIKLFTDINYIKAGEDSMHFRFVTDNGTFIYNTVSGELKYFTLFKDFEIVDNNYIGIIFVDEVEKFKNYSYENKDEENFIIKLDKETNKEDILYKAKINISKILKIEGDNGNYKIVIFRNEDEFYELMNY